MKTNVVERRIMWGDLDALGIVFYPRYYEWMDAGGHLYFESLGLDINRGWKERGLQFGLLETSCVYHHPGRYHDRLEIETSLVKLTSKVVVLRHLITRQVDAQLLVAGMEKRICMDVSDPSAIKAKKIPSDIKKVLENALAVSPG